MEVLEGVAHDCICLEAIFLVCVSVCDSFLRSSMLCYQLLGHISDVTLHGYLQLSITSFGSNHYPSFILALFPRSQHRHT